MTSEGFSLGRRAAAGAAWTAISTILLRLGSFGVGIVLARLLTPEAFGIYAVALTVQAICMSVADLGLSADLIRSDEPERIAPTVATLGLLSGAVMTAITVVSAGAIASSLGSPEAAPVVVILAFTLILGGASVVPFAMLQRRFQQRELFFVGVADFTVSTTITLLLIWMGWGVIALAIGRVAAQLVSTILQFFLARVRPKFSIDRAQLKPVLAFGLPIAAANLLSWTLLNIDNVVLARIAGATALGFYVLAFNISNWPMNALSQVVRAVSLPYFSRSRGETEGLTEISAISWAIALPAGALLAIVSSPIIAVVYGEKWLPAAPALAALGVYGGLRVLFDLFAGYLYAQGRSRPVLWVQILWLVALTIAVIPATHSHGIAGAAWAHVLVAGFVVLPAYGMALHRANVRIRPVLNRIWWPTIAMLAASVVALLAVSSVQSPVGALVVSSAGFMVVYGLIVGPWALRRSREYRTRTESIQVGLNGNS